MYFFFVWITYNFNCEHCSASLSIATLLLSQVEVEKLYMEHGKGEVTPVKGQSLYLEWMAHCWYLEEVDFMCIWCELSRDLS